VTKGTVTGAKGGNVGLDSLLIELARVGLITNSTTRHEALPEPENVLQGLLQYLSQRRWA
jgi:hypothetical protein